MPCALDQHDNLFLAAPENSNHQGFLLRFFHAMVCQIQVEVRQFLKFIWETANHHNFRALLLRHELLWVSLHPKKTCVTLGLQLHGFQRKPVKQNEVLRAPLRNNPPKLTKNKTSYVKTHCFETCEICDRGCFTRTNKRVAMSCQPSVKHFFVAVLLGMKYYGIHMYKREKCMGKSAD